MAAILPVPDKTARINYFVFEHKYGGRDVTTELHRWKADSQLI